MYRSLASFNYMKKCHPIRISNFRLMLGFMLPSWFLSMWISNTATTAMMLPMVEAVLGELEGGEKNVDPEKQVVGKDQSTMNQTSSYSANRFPTSRFVKQFEIN